MIKPKDHFTELLTKLCKGNISDIEINEFYKELIKNHLLKPSLKNKAPLKYYCTAKYKITEYFAENILKDKKYKTLDEYVKIYTDYEGNYPNRFLNYILYNNGDWKYIFNIFDPSIEVSPSYNSDQLRGLATTSVLNQIYTNQSSKLIYFKFGQLNTTQPKQWNPSLYRNIYTTIFDSRKLYTLSTNIFSKTKFINFFNSTILNKKYTNLAYYRNNHNNDKSFNAKENFKFIKYKFNLKLDLLNTLFDSKGINENDKYIKLRSKK